MNILAAMLVVLGAVQWTHPAGMVTDTMVAEVREKAATQAWARDLLEQQRAGVGEWVEIPLDRLDAVFPRKRGNVYHNFSCPDDRCRLTFDPFDSGTFTCPTCGKSFPADTDPGIYEPGFRYHGSMYDGWACIFYLTASSRAVDLGLMARLTDDAEQAAAFRQRGIALLMQFAKTIEPLEADIWEDHQFSRLLTYHREGDNKVLCNLAQAYELLRDHMSEAERMRVEKDVLQRMLDDIMFEPVYRYNHNNVYQWHRTVLQVALALEREDLIDWSFGYGEHDPEHSPEHTSIRKIAATHFKPDGAYWGLNSGYHLYPLYHFCELAVLSHNLVQMDPQRFPPERYDLSSCNGDVGKTIHAALHWFMALAMPDRSVTVIGDSTVPRAGMDSYAMTAEVGYRYFDVLAVGDYPGLRAGKRTWEGLLYGAPAIVHHDLPYTSSYLSSGWVSLRHEWKGNQVWAGLNALIRGSGHQHADRLNLVTYAHGKLLALEKATPYNESVTRNLGTYSYAHNTVTVDRTSQKQGESLEDEEIPEITCFYSGPLAAFAEARGDHIYPQVSCYRRSVAIIEDVILDVFRVEGGTTHDWMANHAGPVPAFSMPMAEGTFEPQDWLYNGTDAVWHATTGDTWEARWQVDGVTSRLTMLGAPGTDVYALETYPIGNAVITPDHPPCQTLCVRREHHHAPFVAVWDAWNNRPNLRSVTRGSTETSLAIETTDNRYWVLVGPGEAAFTDGTRLASDSAFSLVRNRDAVLLVNGTAALVETLEGNLRVACEEPATVVAEYTDGEVRIDIAPVIQYDTYGGEDHPRPAPQATATWEGDLWASSASR